MSTGQGYDNTDKTIAAVILTGAIILLPGGYVTYNFYQKLGDAQAEIEKMKGEATELQRQLQEEKTNLKESLAEVESLQSELDIIKGNLTNTEKDLELAENRVSEREQALASREQDMETLATCLTGVVAALSLLDEGSGADALIMLGRVESSCERSGSIIESLSSSNSSDLPLISS